MDRSLRLAHHLVFSRVAVHWDPVTREPYQFHQRGQALENYVGREDVFGSFTNLPKLGVNPQSSYNTPVGIYAYPIDYIVDQISGADIKVPFQAEAPFLHVFQVKDMSQVWQIYPGETESIDEYWELRKEFDEENKGDEYIEKYSDMLEMMNQIVEDEFSKISSKELHILEVVHFSSKLSQTDHDFVDRWIKNLIHRFDQEAGLDTVDPDFRNKLLDQIGLTKKGGLLSLTGARRLYLNSLFNFVHNYFLTKTMATVEFPYEDEIKNLENAQELSPIAYDQLKRSVLGERVVSDTAFVWNMTRHLSGKNPRTWMGLLRKLGLTGVIDHGTSTIHEQEPTQAVFFDFRVIKVLDRIDNQLGQWSSSTQEFKPLQETPAGALKREWSRDVYEGMDEAVRRLAKIMGYLGVSLEEARDEKESEFYRRNQYSQVISYVERIASILGWVQAHKGVLSQREYVQKEWEHVREWIEGKFRQMKAMDFSFLKEDRQVFLQKNLNLALRQLQGI
jgi:hypothetical protein